jgi:diadenosine tetraphosphate (Ap4A) HIT family hydrolase
MTGCVLCETDGGALVWRGARWRLIRAEEPHVPAFWRWIANDHISEFSELSDDAALECIQGLRLIERTLIRSLTELGHRPTKINLASLGNAVPHLHWHVVARYAHDAHFPAPIWAAPARAEAAAAWEASVRTVLPQVDAALAHALQAFAER